MKGHPMSTDLATDRFHHASCRQQCRRDWLGVLVFLALGLVPLSPTLAQNRLDQIRNSGILRWGADQEGGGPYVYPSPENPNKLVGFEVDIANELANRLGVEPAYVQGQWDKLPDLLNRGDIDIVLNGYEWNPSRSERFGLSIPYYVYQLQLLVRDDDDRIESFESLKSKNSSVRYRVGVLGGSAAHDYLANELGDQIDIIQFEGASEVMRGVELGLDGLDANLQDLPVWNFYRSGYPRLRPAGPPIGPGFYVVMTRKEDRELLKAINEAILQMLSDGTLRRILSTYGLWDTTQAMRGLGVNPDGSFVGGMLSSEDIEATSSSTEVFHSARGWTVVQQRGLLLARAAGMTVLLAVCAMPLAIAVGMIMAVSRLMGPTWLRFLVQTYIELVRGTPLVLQLYVIFFLLPELGFSIHAFWAGVLGLAINYSAYEAEIYRAGIQAIPKGQSEAAMALGMSRFLTLRRVILPQATKLVIPPVTNDFIALFKDTAVCSVITVVELSKEYSIHARSTGAIVELGLLTAILYLAMSYPLSLLASYLERRMAGGAR